MIFGVHTSSSSHIDNHRNKFLILGEGDTFGINGSLGVPEKILVSIFLNQTQLLLKSSHYNGDNSYLLVNGQETYNFKVIETTAFQSRLCLGSISDGFSATESRKVSLNVNVYDFSVDYNSVDKSDVSNIHKYLINLIKNTIK